MSGTLTEMASLLFSSNRSISGGDLTIIPDLTIRERHRDTLGITSHPVETGAAISDHAFKMPPEFSLEFGWSNSSANALMSTFSGSTASDLLTGNFGEEYCRQVYETLIALQESRKLCQVVTGKRLYKNVLLESIETSTEAGTAYSMFVTVNCRSLQIVSTSETTVSNIQLSNQANPASTAPVVNMGTKNLKEVPIQTSAPAMLFGGLFGG
ncbi:phage baseplate protein [Acetobacter indonesiensis]|uniref:phage baseplate protein n=1 Tax=Acetobacter indonesiensis TaxID=104101 RepID=UPI0039ED1C96